MSTPPFVNILSGSDGWVQEKAPGVSSLVVKYAEYRKAGRRIILQRYKLF